MNYNYKISPYLKTLYNENDKDFLEKCVELCCDGMKHLNHWNIERTQIFNSFPKNLKIVEVGVHCGKNAYRIYNVCKPTHLYLVDPFDRIQENEKQRQDTNLIEQQNHEKNVRLFFDGKSDVTILKEWSIEACSKFQDNELDLVYIDADHCYEAVLLDLTHWSKKIKESGFIGGHDYDNRNGFIQQALTKFLENNNNFKLVYTPPAHLWQADSSDGHYDFLLQKIK